MSFGLMVSRDGALSDAATGLGSRLYAQFDIPSPGSCPVSFSIPVKREIYTTLTVLIPDPSISLVGKETVMFREIRISPWNVVTTYVNGYPQITVTGAANYGSLPSYSYTAKLTVFLSGRRTQ